MGKDIVERIESMEECLVKYMEGQLSEGVVCLYEGNNYEIAGGIIDMIKDLADAKKNCHKAKYYETVVEAMEDAKEEGEGRYGYDGWRYSNGRYAPKGEGHRSGYSDMYPGPMMDDIWNDDIYGYTPSGMGNRSQSGNRRSGYDGMGMGPDGIFGRSYRDYKDAKRSYTETRSPSDKQKMNDHAKEHVETAVETFREIYDSADDTLRIRMKTDLANLINEMK